MKAYGVHRESRFPKNRSDPPPILGFQPAVQQASGSGRGPVAGGVPACLLMRNDEKRFGIGGMREIASVLLYRNARKKSKDFTG